MVDQEGFDSRATAHARHRLAWSKDTVIKTLAGVGTAGLLAMLTIAAHGQMGTTAPSNGPKAEAVVDATGNLHVPDAYRATYQSLGSWAVAAEQGQGSKELHVVYASPGTIAAYRKDGHFADGAVLVKEVFQAATGQMTTGTVSHAETLKGWFVMMKDTNGRHAGNKLWGDGWGWSWFDAANPSKTNLDRLQNELSILSCAGAGFRLDLCQRIPAAEAIGPTVTRGGTGSFFYGT